ncbi:M1 family aminopeptidase [Flammeovirga sp. SubArs3]|uniref:ABC transporter permease/M1 family aminopeptidase n=1 Tax=Flammeovirga sp. SubArs3 TaxID=2995316 RepID=UPI00248B845C|nr:M1 family aminopeptidase [Flammeovirga sp. SubArs3]
MFIEFFSKEIKGALKQPMIYIFTGIVALLCFGATASDKVIIGGAIGNVHANAPQVILGFSVILSIFGVMFAAAFFNNAALRDFSNEFNEILFSAPIKKFDYFFGRFLGALVLSTIPFLGIYIGSILGSFIGPLAGWIDAERMGVTPWSAFIWSYFVLVIPNMLIAGTIIFGLASQFRNTTISFVGAMLIIVGYILGLSFASDLDNEKVAALIDLFANSAVKYESKYFTPAEKNTILPSISSTIGLNRLIWIGISTGLVYLFYSLFTFETKKSVRKEKKEKETNTSVTFTKPKVSYAFSSSTDWIKFASFMRVNLISIFKSNTFKIMIIFSLIMIFADLLEGYEYYGLQSYPVTYKILDSIDNSSAIFIMIIVVYYSGELIWQSRDAHINEVIDATPHSSFLSLLANTLSIVIMVSILFGLLTVVGVLYQLGNGYFNIKLDVYLISFLLTRLPSFIALSLIFSFIHVVIDQKYIGYGVSILAVFGSTIILNIMDISSNMLIIGGAPFIQYSDMNGFGPNVLSVLWFNLYWFLLGLALLLIASLMWQRGTASTFKERVLNIKKNMDSSYMGAISLVFVIWLAVAGNIYYNTQILNDYKTSDVTEDLQVKYEKKYKQYDGINQPVITDINYNISIFPDERNVYSVNEITLINKGKTAIDSIFFTMNDNWETELILTGAKEVFHDEEIGFKKISLYKPLQVGEEMKMIIKSNFISKGFHNNSANLNIVENGTFFNNLELLPIIGYSKRYELADKFKRKEHGLPYRKRTPELSEDNNHDLCYKNYLSEGVSDWVNISTTISTSGDQMAIAPGSMIKSWKEAGRNYYTYVVDHPSQYFASFISADYKIAKKTWNGIDLEVYYTDEHKVNVDRMLSAIEKSLKYYTENYGPYFHKQARIIEFPRYSTFAQAFPGTMPYSEAFGFIINLENETDNNIIDAVIAHEMAHQWWAHQEVGADIQGSTMLTETFAEYSALMVMKQESDDIKMKDFLKYNMNRYLRGRTVEKEKEMPLYKVENQGYIHYGKGSIIMYALQNYIGEDSVNSALREFLSEFRYKEPPYPTSIDFLNHLSGKVPDSLQYIVDDWFKEITLYDYRLTDVIVQKTDSAQYTYTLNIEARKVKSDSLGNEVESQLDDWVDIGFFADADAKELIYTERIKVNQPKIQLQFTLDQKAEKASIDPKRLLIERIYDDNTKKINI